LGSLGRLEELAIKIAGIKGELLPKLEHKAIVTMAADHGVVAEGVAAYPQEVTRQMVYNFLNGGAGINVNQMVMELVFQLVNQPLVLEHV
jgi:nicotinate-nucleotide--dimethylbenzimidazole phosphoribosyltransferase